MEEEVAVEDDEVRFVMSHDSVSLKKRLDMIAQSVVCPICDKADL